jgi:hypothetical protein
MALLVISYSRVDQPQVVALVRFLQGAYRGIEKAVYWDGDFEPGEPWFEQMKRYIDASPQLFVFWCVHSSSSEQVRREFAYALEQKKRVVPILVDDTRLVPELAAIHGIDLRGALQHSAKIPSSPLEETRWRDELSTDFGVSTGSVGRRLDYEPSTEFPMRQPPMRSPEAKAHSARFGWLLAMLGIVSLVLAGWALTPFVTPGRLLFISLLLLMAFAVRWFMQQTERGLRSKDVVREVEIRYEVPKRENGSVLQPLDENPKRENGSVHQFPDIGLIAQKHRQSIIRQFSEYLS